MRWFVLIVLAILQSALASDRTVNRSLAVELGTMFEQPLTTFTSDVYDRLIATHNLSIPTECAGISREIRFHMIACLIKADLQRNLQMFVGEEEQMAMEVINTPPANFDYDEVDEFILNNYFTVMGLQIERPPLVPVLTQENSKGA